MKDKDFDKLLKHMVIIIDTREQVNSHITFWLKKNKIEFINSKLDYGDYSFYIKPNDILNNEELLYFNDKISIERKANLEELSGNFSVDKERIEREFERHKGNMILLIEDNTYKDICNHNYDTKLNEDSYLAMLHSYSHRYEIPFIFVDSGCSGRFIYNMFKYYLREYYKKIIIE